MLRAPWGNQEAPPEAREGQEKCWSGLGGVRQQWDRDAVLGARSLRHSCCLSGTVKVSTGFLVEKLEGKKAGVFS